MSNFWSKQPSSRQGAVQNIAYTATAASASVFGAQTTQIRLSANSACFYLISGGGGAAATVATASNASYLPANTVEYLTVTGGMTLSVVEAPTGGLVTATSGPLNVVEMS
jgi:hypothetical protein